MKIYNVEGTYCNLVIDKDKIRFYIGCLDGDSISRESYMNLLSLTNIATLNRDSYKVTIEDSPSIYDVSELHKFIDAHRRHTNPKRIFRVGEIKVTLTEEDFDIHNSSDLVRFLNMELEDKEYLIKLLDEKLESIKYMNSGWNRLYNKEGEEVLYSGITQITTFPPTNYYKNEMEHANKRRLESIRSHVIEMIKL